MQNFLFFLSIGALITVIFCSFFEWLLHRFVMHKIVLGFKYAFRTHTLTHHRVFKADESYHLDPHLEHKNLVTMAWWNGPLLILTCQIPFFIAAIISGQFGLLAGSVLACSIYYGAYEYMHFCMHVPRTRNIERSGIFFRLNGHHLLHHRYMNRNFNVVLPLADLCLGTLLLRSKVCFAQARGPALPCVQPKTGAATFRLFDQ